jgi:hypothetical protein
MFVLALFGVVLAAIMAMFVVILLQVRKQVLCRRVSVAYGRGAFGAGFRSAYTWNNRAEVTHCWPLVTWKSKNVRSILKVWPVEVC